VQQAVVIRAVGFLQVGEFCAVGEIDVEFAVVVEIEEGHAAAHGLREVLSAGEAVVGDVGDFRARSDVDKTGLAGSLCRGADGHAQ